MVMLISMTVFFTLDCHLRRVLFVLVNLSWLCAVMAILIPFTLRSTKSDAREI